jgi:hypothetical protein
MLLGTVAPLGIIIAAGLLMLPAQRHIANRGSRTNGEILTNLDAAR